MDFHLSVHCPQAVHFLATQNGKIALEFPVLACRQNGFQ